MSLSAINNRNELLDEFELTDSILGPLPDWFFPALGRVVAVSAVLENKARILAETLANQPQDILTMASVAKLRKAAITAAGRIDTANSGSGMSTVDLTSQPPLLGSSMRSFACWIVATGSFTRSGQRSPVTSSLGGGLLATTKMTRHA